MNVDLGSNERSDRTLDIDDLQNHYSDTSFDFLGSIFDLCFKCEIVISEATIFRLNANFDAIFATGDPKNLFQLHWQFF